MPANAILYQGKPAVSVSHTVNGVRRRKMVTDPARITSMEQATAVAAAINKMLKEGTFRWDANDDGIEKPTPDWTFERYATRWLAENRPLLKASTSGFYEWNVTNYLIPAMGRAKLRAIDRSVCRSVVKGLLDVRGKRTKRALAIKTREGIWCTLSAVMAAAVDDDLLSHNPAHRLGKYLGENRRVLKNPINPYTFEESTWFLQRVQHFAPHLYAFFFMALRTGMRVGELEELRWTDFPAHRPREVHICRNFSLAQAKVDRLAGLPKAERGITTPKSKRDRYVDCSPQVLAVLKAERVTQRERAFKKGRPVPELCFTSKHGKRLGGNYVLRRLVPRICTTPLDGVPKVRRITIHALRHTYVTQMLLKGGINALPYIARQVGHRDISTTEKIYAHWLTEHRDEVLSARLDEAPVRLAEDL